MAGSKRNARLGRGLSSLMAQPVSTDPASQATTADKETSTAQGSETGPPQSPDGVAAEGFTYVAIERIRPNPHQPRKHIEHQTLQPLVDSIRTDGIMQPIVLRHADHVAHADQAPGIDYELVAGERRWRAAQLAELTHVPAIVRSLDEQQTAEVALIENIQREDLNPIERAEAFQHLTDAFGLSHQQIGQRVGLNRSTVANLLRLLNLSETVRDYVRRDLLSMGQARSVAGLSDADQQRHLADQAVRQGLSVRQVEQAVRRLTQGPPVQNSSQTGGSKSNDTRSNYLTDLERQMTEQLQTKVHLHTGRKKGTGSITIDFYNLDQFEALLTRLGIVTE